MLLKLFLSYLVIGLPIYTVVAFATDEDFNFIPRSDLRDKIYIGALIGIASVVAIGGTLFVVMVVTFLLQTIWA